MSPRKGILLAYPFEESRLMKWRPPYFVQPKLDGDRCRAIFASDCSVTLLSSEENVIAGVPHINKALERLGLSNLELDGELYTHNMNHETIHGIMSRYRNLHPSFAELEFHIFDIVNEDIQVHRTGYLYDYLYPRLKPPLRMVRTIFAYNLEDVLRAYDTILGQGYEGIIVRDHEAPYIRRRSTQVMKFKPKKEDLYVVTGAVEEISIDGKPKNSLGALTCIANDGEATFNVGTGFSAEQRQELWKKREILPGKIVRVAYQHITSGKGVPRFPVFVELIWDLTDFNQQKID